MFIRRGGRLPRLHPRGPGDDSLRAPSTVRVGREAWSVISLGSAKTRMGRQIEGWWRRLQARKERSSPALPSPGGRHQTSDDCRSIARVEYEAGDLIVAITVTWG
jgi:hypothetical protein